MECENAYVFVYLLGIVVAATHAAMRDLANWKERLALCVLLCPGLGIVAYLAFVAANCEVFSSRVFRLIVVLESIVLTLAVTTHMFLQQCSLTFVCIACCRAMLTHLLLFRFF